MDEALGRLGDLDIVESSEESLRIAVREGSRRLPALFTALAETGAEVRETTMIELSLESLFINLTARQLRE